MNFIHAIIFGAVEGASEFLPISSTGHLILTAKLLGLAQTEFLKSFEIAIQLGAILSVVVLYWKSFVLERTVLKRVLAAFIPTAALGFIFYKSIKHFVLGNSQVVLWALFLGGVFLIVFENLYRGKEGPIQKISAISYPQALLIGVFQSIAVIPGVSRSMATIVGGLILGVRRKTIVEFSFLLAVPTMLAATGLDLIKSAGAFSSNQFGFLFLGFAASFVVAILCIQWLLSFVKNHTFIPFGIYRILLALIFWFGFRS